MSRPPLQPRTGMVPRTRSPPRAETGWHEPDTVVKGLSEVPQVQAVSDRYTEGVRGSRLLELPETGHLPSVERPGELTAAPPPSWTRSHGAPEPDSERAPGIFAKPAHIQ